MEKLADIRAAVREKCNEYMGRWKKWNAKDPEPYRQCGDMNRYLGALLKRGWSVPFILSDFAHAKAALNTNLRYYRESGAHHLLCGDPAGYEGSLIYAGLLMTGECTEELEQRVQEYFEIPSGYANLNVLIPDLQDVVVLAFAGRTDFLPTVLQKIERNWRDRPEQFGTDEKTIPPALSVLEAESLFWSKDKERLAPLSDTLLDTINRMPVRCFGEKNNRVPLHWPKDFYVSFAFYLKFLFPPSRFLEKAERAATMMIYCLTENNIDLDSILAVKYYEIIAQMIAGKDKELIDFYKHFPTLSKFLSSVAEAYRE